MFSSRFNLVSTGFSLLLLALLSWYGNSFANTNALEWTDTFVHNRPALRANMPLTKWRKNGFLNHIYKFNNTPLGNRTPVIIMPGRAQEFQQRSWWKRFYKQVKKNPAFNEHYKLYAFIYESEDEVDVHAADFLEELHAYFGDFLEDGRQVKLVCYSLGGTIAQIALQDENALKLVSSIQAMSVSFHGSPMFNKAWFQQHLSPENHSPIRKLWDRSLFKLYFMGKSNLNRGLAWDNFDSSQPIFGHNASKAKFQGDQIVSYQKTYQEQPLAKDFKSKLTVYASYINNQFTDSDGVNGLVKVVTSAPKLPKVILNAFLPTYSINVHAAMNYMNYQLATLPTYDPQYPEGQIKNLYRYNDGAFPLSSMLYLPKRDNAYNEDLSRLTQFLDVKQARIFEDIDHVEMGGYTLRQSKTKTPDLMSPGSAPKTPTQWIINDLLNDKSTKS